MTSSDRVMSLLKGDVPLTLLLDLATVATLPEGELLEAPSVDGLLIEDSVHFDYEMAV